MVLPVSGSPFETGVAPISIAVDAVARLVYVANSGENNISAYPVGSNGALIPVPNAPFPAGFAPVSVAVDPTGRFAYVANKMSNKRLSVPHRSLRGA